MRRPARQSALAMLLLAGCAARSKDPAPAGPTAPAASAPTRPAARDCGADVTEVESTATRMAFEARNRSKSAASGTIRELRLLFTPSRCPITVESPPGWSGTIEVQTARHYCEAAWVTTVENGVPVGAKRDGFVVTFRRGKKETPSWAVFLDGCAVSGPSTPGR